MDPTGAYTEDEAAALSGVPGTTIRYWATHDVLKPSVSPERQRLWSHADLMGLRIIYWLRQPKNADGSLDLRDADPVIPRTAMPKVRRALAELAAMKRPIWARGAESSLVVNRAGHVYITAGVGLRSPDGQIAHRDLLDVVAPFAMASGLRGPDLLMPRPRVRIHPGRLSGAPHIVDTRLETRALASLHEAGFPPAKILELYPYLSEDAIRDALELEAQLRANLRRAA